MEHHVCTSNGFKCTIINDTLISHMHIMYTHTHTPTPTPTPTHPHPHPLAPTQVAVEPGSPYIFLSCGEDGSVLEVDLRDEPRRNKQVACDSHVTSMAIVE